LTSPERISQQAYWGGNLDPQNLGAGGADCDAIAAEFPFYLTPDQRCALDALQPLAGSRVLDIGAGLGVNALYLASRGACVIATDIAVERLAVLRRFAGGGGVARAARIGGPSPAPGGRLFAVRCAAERLPFRRGAFTRACSKSVLIHTRLPDAASEAARVLAAGGRAVFVEPMTGNPFANLYRRTLAPQVWRDITTYFAGEQMDAACVPFSRSRRSFHYLLAFLAFAFQFGVRAPLLFRPALAVLSALDRVLFAVCPPLKKLAWFVVISADR
jgi:SAM-dependent methyltransferase